MTSVQGFLRLLVFLIVLMPVWFLVLELNPQFKPTVSMLLPPRQAIWWPEKPLLQETVSTIKLNQLVRIEGKISAANKISSQGLVVARRFVLNTVDHSAKANQEYETRWKVERALGAPFMVEINPKFLVVVNYTGVYWESKQIPDSPHKGSPYWEGYPPGQHLSCVGKVMNLHPKLQIAVSDDNCHPETHELRSWLANQTLGPWAMVALAIPAVYYVLLGLLCVWFELMPLQSWVLRRQHIVDDWKLGYWQRSQPLRKLPIHLWIYLILGGDNSLFASLRPFCNPLLHFFTGLLLTAIAGLLGLADPSRKTEMVILAVLSGIMVLFFVLLYRKSWHEDYQLLQLLTHGEFAQVQLISKEPSKKTQGFWKVSFKLHLPNNQHQILTDHLGDFQLRKYGHRLYEPHVLGGIGEFFFILYNPVQPQKFSYLAKIPVQLNQDGSLRDISGLAWLYLLLPMLWLYYDIVLFPGVLLPLM